MGCVISIRKPNQRSSMTGVDKHKYRRKRTSESLNANPYKRVKKDEVSMDGQAHIRSLNLKGRGKRSQTFRFQELVAATGNFRLDSFLGEGGFGKVYRGHISRINREVAIKQLNHHGDQGTREFVVEVLTLSVADHPNLVKLIGFCAEGSQKLLVYEYMPLGSLDRRLHDLSPYETPLDWYTRMKIAAGAAKGLEYLHEKMKPHVIYRDLKCSNILLGEGYHPKLSDFGLAKVGPCGDHSHVSTRVMGTYGYCAPDYVKTGQLTFKSDIYSFGIVLLEIVTGRKAFDSKKPRNEQNLVEWARPLFRNRKNFYQMVDPLLQGQFPVKGMYQSLAIAAMCVQEDPNLRPNISDVVLALEYLSSQRYMAANQSKEPPRYCLPAHALENHNDGAKCAGDGSGKE